MLLRTFRAALQDVSDEAVQETASRYFTGKVPDQSTRFAPSVAEFAQEAEKRQAFIELRNKPRIAAPAPVYRGYDFQDRQEAARQKNAHREIILENASHDDWLRMSRRKEVPVGASWVACIATIYGPEPLKAAKSYQEKDAA